MTDISTLADQVKQERRIPMASAVLDSGEIVEMLHRPDEQRTLFVVGDRERWEEQDSVAISSRSRLVPYSPTNNLLRHKVVLFPSAPEEYESEATLLADIRRFIHRYVDVSSRFEEIASYYVLFSWIHDAFNELPYLRVRGDYGCGKSRFLLIIGSLCYKPIFASGASTVSPLFRILDLFGGTLIIDEGDFRVSDERAEIVKILNNGHARGFPVLRCEVTASKEFDPRAYSVFGPKLVATRGYFQDRALESRFLVEEMGQRPLRPDIPINLPSDYETEALQLRNKLLLFRLRTRHKPRKLHESIDRKVEPRLNQIFSPLLSIIEDPEAREGLRDLARSYQDELITERGMEMEGQVLDVIRDLWGQSDEPVAIGDITSLFLDRHGEDYDRKVTPKWIGSLVRRKLQLKPRKSHGVFVIPPSEQPKLRQLYQRYGIGDSEQEGPEPPKE